MFWFNLIGFVVFFGALLFVIAGIASIKELPQKYTRVDGSQVEIIDKRKRA